MLKTVMRMPAALVIAGLTICSTVTDAQVVPSVIPTITAIDVPVGTATAPFYVIDSDATSTNPLVYDRDTFPVSVTVNFKLAKGFSSGSETFRVTTQLIDDQGAAVGISGGTTAAQTVTVNLFSVNRVFDLDIDPSADLGAGRGYFLRVRVQRQDPPSIPGGKPRWTTADGPDDSGVFTVVHFTGPNASDPAVNVRGYTTGAASWTRRYAVVTDPDKDEFTLSVPYRLMRYDVGEGYGSNMIGIELDVDLVDDLGNPVALANDGKSTQSLRMWRYLLATTGNPVVPTGSSGSLDASFRPVDGVVLDPVNRTYRATVTLRHVEVAPDTLWEDGSEETPLIRMLHFNGLLHWDSVITTMHSISNHPGVASTTSSYVNTQVAVDGNEGAVNNRPDLEFGSGALLNVRLYADGHAVVVSGEEGVTRTGPVAHLTADFGNVAVEYGSCTLSSSGPYATNVQVQLPQGLGYTPDTATSRNRFARTLEFAGDTPLDANFRHTLDLIRPLPAGAGVFDEARPLVYQATQAEFFNTGVIKFGTPGPGGVDYAHAEAFEQLEDDAANGYHQEPEMAERATNDGYMRYLDLESEASLTFDAVADGSVRLNGVTMDLQAGAFTAHYPVGADISWSQGILSYDHGGIEAGGGIVDVVSVTLPFDGSCPDDDCASGASTEKAITLEPESKALYFSKDGGLHAPGTVSPTSLQWGLRGDGSGQVTSYAHRTGDFTTGWFQMAGQQGYASENPALDSGAPWGEKLAADMAPASVLFAGYDPGNHKNPVYPGSPEYVAGEGFYAGHNFIADKGLDGASRLGGARDDYPYTLRDFVSKYYVRRGGLSGRHVPMEGSYASEMMVYDYFFEVERFQLTFLSNQNELSWFDGAVHVPEPSGFTQKFLGLELTCTGELSRPEINPEDTGAKQLTYWNGEFNPVAMEFAEIEDTGRCYPDRALVIGLTTEVAHVPGLLAGKLAFMNDGNIGTMAKKVEGTDGRLGIPATIPLAGPAGERWSLVPTTKLYFNNPEHAGAESGPGFVTFAGTMNVPYFEDVEIQMITSANGMGSANVHLTGGWDLSGDTYFTDPAFDPDHRGFPPEVPLTTYKNLPTGPNYTRDSDVYARYRVTASQSLFGLVDLEYPLDWSIAGRYFKSAYPMNEDDLVVLEDAFHQVDYMSPQDLEVSFGAKYDGLPEINLASAIYSAADDELGASEALAQAATSFVTSTLEDGVDEMGKLASDTLEELLDEAIGAMEDDVLDPLYDAVVTSYTAARNNHDSYNDWAVGVGTDLQSEFDRYLDGTLGGAQANMLDRLRDLADATAGAASLVQRVEDAVDRGILAIDSVAGQLQTVQGTGGEVVALDPLPGDVVQTINGILAKVDVGGGTYERRIVQALVNSLVQELAGPQIANAVGVLFNEATGQVNAQLNALLSEMDPTLDRIVEALMEARSDLVAVKTELQGAGEIVASFQVIINNAQSELNTIVAEVRATADGFILQIASMAQVDLNEPLDEFGNLLDEFSREEFKALLRAELRDRLLSSDFIGQIQYALRQWIYDLDMVLHSAIDSAFAEVRRLTKLVIQEALGPIDESINRLVGDIGDYLGSGEIDGYAHIEGDSLKRLRIDGKFQFKIPDDMEINAYLEILAYDSGDDFGSSACLQPGDEVLEVKIGATDLAVDWISPDMRADLEVKFSMMTDPSLAPRGVGGSFEMTGGELEFEAFTITEFAAAVGVAIGNSDEDKECYIAASARMEFSSYEVEGGIFFGRTCTLDPIEMINADVAALLGTAPFTGAYVYGEVWLPISEMLTGIPASCLFRISAGVGAGAFYFVEGPTWGGQLLLGVSGEALCIVSIKGELKMIGVMAGNEMRFSGRGSLKGKAGCCPFCIKFSKSAKFEYQDGDWSVDY